MRAFLAVEISEEVRAGLDGLVAALRPALPGWRWAPSSAHHVTIRFLGEVDAEVLRGAVPAWRSALAALPAFHFEVSGLGVFPSPRSPRVLWIGVREVSAVGGFEAIFRAVEMVAVACGLPPEPRPFHPHVTLARAARDARPKAADRSAPSDFGPLVAREVVLYRSELLPGGARHTPLERFALAARP